MVRGRVEKSNDLIQQSEHPRAAPRHRHRVPRLPGGTIPAAHLILLTAAAPTTHNPGKSPKPFPAAGTRPAPGSRDGAEGTGNPDISAQRTATVAQRCCSAGGG